MCIHIDVLQASGTSKEQNRVLKLLQGVWVRVIDRVQLFGIAFWLATPLRSITVFTH